jgi:predicted RNase H-like HicB family nuclease
LSIIVAPASIIQRFASAAQDERISDKTDIIKSMAYNFKIETDREEDGRWIAEIPDLPGVMAYGTTRDDAIRSVEALALRVLEGKLTSHRS